MNQQQASKAQSTLKGRLLAYFQDRPGQWVPSADIQRLVIEQTPYTAQNAGRRLRELHEAGELDVEYRGRNHAHYRYQPHHTKRIYEIKIVDGVAVQTFKDITV